jgi:hypothetical protein
MEDWVAHLVRSGQIADIAMAVLIAEAIMIGVVLRRRAALASLAFTMASGFGLLGALRAALGHAPETVIALWLIAALAAHAADIYTRLSARRSDP